MGFFRKSISKVEGVPKFYGIVGYNYRDDRIEVALFPFNIPVAIAAYLWAGVKLALVKVSQDPRVAYNQGLKDGRKK